MTTMKDVAKEAGVSIATVSYYINKKKVSSQKAVRIADAIAKLNYVAQNSGRNLRAKNNADIGLVFPDIAEPYLEKLISSIKGLLSYHERKFNLELSDGNPENETKLLMDFIGRRMSGIILYSCQPGNRQIFETLNASGIPFVLIDRKPEDLECNFVSCDNFALFHDLAGHFLDRGKRAISLVCGRQEYNENRSAYEGYTAAFRERGLEPDFALTVWARPLRESGFRAGMELLERGGARPSILLTTSMKLAEGLRYALLVNRIRVGEEVVIVTSGDSEDDIFFQDPTIAKTSRSAFEIGESAGRILLDNIASPVIFEKQQRIIRDECDTEQLLAGQPFLSATCGARGPKASIKVLVIDDYASIGALQRLLADFHSRENIEVEFTKIFPENSYDYIIDHLGRPDCDIDAFLFDIPWLQYLCEQGFLRCLDSFFDEYKIDSSQFIPGMLEQFSRCKDHYYALPYISTTQLMFYRKDLFGDEHLARSFEERYKIPLLPPCDWLQYSAISRFFTRHINPDSPVEYGNAMDISYTEQLMCSFLPRLWAYGGDLFDKAGKPTLATSSARKAIRNMLECVLTAHPDSFVDRPVDAVRKLVSGQVAMLVTFFNYATDIADREVESVVGKIGYASIPGSMPVMGGWSFGVNSLSKNPDAAFKFISWACSSDIAIPHTILGGQSPQLKTYRNYDMVTLYPWLTKALSEFSRVRKRHVPSSRGRARYSEKAIENIIAAELFDLINVTMEFGCPVPERIDEALQRVERSIKSLDQR